MNTEEFRQFYKENRGVVLSTLIGHGVMWIGLIVLAVGMFIQNITVTILGVGLFGISWLIRIPQFLFTGKMKRKRALELSEKQRASRQREMNRIRKSMTPGEWETYKLQLENQRLLQEIKNRPSGQTSGPRAMYGLTQEIGD